MTHRLSKILAGSCSSQVASSMLRSGNRRFNDTDARRTDLSKFFSIPLEAILDALPSPRFIIAMFPLRLTIKTANALGVGQTFSGDNRILFRRPTVSMVQWCSQDDTRVPSLGSELGASQETEYCFVGEDRSKTVRL
jgi:hypothetical protein